MRLFSVFLAVVLILPISAAAFDKFKIPYTDLKLQQIRVGNKNIPCVFKDDVIAASRVVVRTNVVTVKSYRFLRKVKIKNLKTRLAKGLITEEEFITKRKQVKKRFKNKFTKACQIEARSLFDEDGDLVGNDDDNCPNVFNPQQVDSDNDSKGDVCDSKANDRDSDGVTDAIDSTGDGLLDAYDQDYDGTFDEFDTNADGIIDALDTNQDSLPDLSARDLMSQFDSRNPDDFRYLAKSAGYGVSPAEEYLVEMTKTAGLQAAITEYMRDKGYLEPAVLDAYDRLDYGYGREKGVVYINGPATRVYYNINGNGTDYLYRDKDHNTNIPCLKDDPNLRLVDGSKQDPEGGNLSPLPIVKLDRGLRYGHVRLPLVYLHAHTENPYLERMTKFLMSVWTVGIKNADNWTKYSGYISYYDHLRILARDGDLVKIATGVTKSFPMLEYLDGQFNEKGKVNENYSREFLELFATGTINPLTGEENYNSADITSDNPTNDLQELARVFTGYKSWPNYTTAADGTPLCVRTARHTYSSTRADLEPKTLFNTVSAPTISVAAGEGMESVVAKIIQTHPSVPYYYAERILKHYVEPSPSKLVIKAFGDIIKANNMNIRVGMEKLFRSKYFYSRSLHENTLSVDIFDWFISIARKTGVTPQITGSRSIYTFYDRSRMNLITPPSVFWFSPDTWSSAANNFAKDNISADLYDEIYDRLQSTTNIKSEIATNRDPMHSLRHLCPANQNASQLLSYAADLHGVNLTNDQKLTLEFQLNNEISSSQGDQVIAYDSNPSFVTNPNQSNAYFNAIRQKMRKCIELHHIVSAKHPDALVR